MQITDFLFGYSGDIFAQLNNLLVSFHRGYQYIREAAYIYIMTYSKSLLVSHSIRVSAHVSTFKKMHKQSRFFRNVISKCGHNNKIFNRRFLLTDT